MAPERREDPRVDPSTGGGGNGPQIGAERTGPATHIKAAEGLRLVTPVTTDHGVPVGWAALLAPNGDTIAGVSQNGRMVEVYDTDGNELCRWDRTAPGASWLDAGPPYDPVNRVPNPSLGVSADGLTFPDGHKIPAGGGPIVCPHDGPMAHFSPEKPAVLLLPGDGSVTACYDNDAGLTSLTMSPLARRLMATRLRHIADSIEAAS